MLGCSSAVQSTPAATCDELLSELSMSLTAAAVLASTVPYSSTAMSKKDRTNFSSLLGLQIVAC